MQSLCRVAAVRCICCAPQRWTLARSISPRGWPRSVMVGSCSMGLDRSTPTSSSVPTGQPASRRAPPGLSMLRGCCGASPCVATSRPRSLFRSLRCGTSNPAEVSPATDGCFPVPTAPISDLVLGSATPPARSPRPAATRRVPRASRADRSARIGRPARPVRQLGGWLKLGVVGTRPAAGKVLLVGDAAGLVNPLQGRGSPKLWRADAPPHRRYSNQPGDAAAWLSAMGPSNLRPMDVGHNAGSRHDRRPSSLYRRFVGDAHRSGCRAIDCFDVGDLLEQPR